MDFWAWMVSIIAIVVGLPVLLDFFQKVNRDNIRARELALEEKRLAMEERLKSDALNTRLIEMDNMGISPLDITSMQDELRQLRAEVANLRQEMDNRIIK